MFETEAIGWLPDRLEKVELKYDSVYSNGIDRSIKATVLLVDDNSDLREYIKTILSRKYIIATASNGKRALELIRDGLQPDLILADVMMPEMDGYGLLSELRRNRSSLSRIPFVILSAKASEEERIEGMRLGADDYLVKPFSSEELMARIDSRIQLAGYAE